MKYNGLSRPLSVDNLCIVSFFCCHFLHLDAFDSTQPCWLSFLHLLTLTGEAAESLSLFLQRLALLITDFICACPAVACSE
eukprot:55145-Pleurochrysis_carterae.AAC.3